MNYKAAAQEHDFSEMWRIEECKRLFTKYMYTLSYDVINEVFLLGYKNGHSFVVKCLDEKHAQYFNLEWNRTRTVTIADSSEPVYLTSTDGFAVNLTHSALLCNKLQTFVDFEMTDRYERGFWEIAKIAATEGRPRWELLSPVFIADWNRIPVRSSIVTR